MDVAPSTIRAARRRLAIDAIGLSFTAAGFGLVYGLAARQAGLSVAEAVAMSVFVLAGGAQFAAVGFLVQGMSWLGIVAFTALLNARHVLYAAALAPFYQDRPRIERAAMAHVLTDETFALNLAEVRTLGHGDAVGYWLSAALVCPLWIIGSALGSIGTQFVTDPRAVGLDVIFPASMAGLAAGFMTGRRELAAAVAGTILAVVVGLSGEPSIGIVAGGLGGPAVAMLVPDGESG
jgi:4-azaleucine resistance transporter AzlC